MLNVDKHMLFIVISDHFRFVLVHWKCDANFFSISYSFAAEIMSSILLSLCFVLAGDHNISATYMGVEAAGCCSVTKVYSSQAIVVSPLQDCCLGESMEFLSECSLCVLLLLFSWKY